MSRVGIGVIAKDLEQVQECVSMIQKHTLVEKIIVINNTDENFKIDGILVIKLGSITEESTCRVKCIEFLKDCEHVFIFKSDCWPIKDGWVNEYIRNSKNSKCHHFCFSNGSKNIKDIKYGTEKTILKIEGSEDFILDNFINDDQINTLKERNALSKTSKHTQTLEFIYKIKIHSNQKSSMFYFSKECLKKIDLKTLKLNNFSQLINSSGLTPFGTYLDIENSEDYFVKSLNNNIEEVNFKTFNESPKLEIINSYKKRKKNIYYSIPYDVNKNIGKFYNDFMKTLPNEDDYACFVDGDTMFTTYNYGHVIQQIVEENPTIGFFTALTNRIGCKWQIESKSSWENDDMIYHRNLGEELQNKFQTECEDKTFINGSQPFSGILMLIKKSTWRKVGGFLEEGMLGVDNDFSQKLYKHNEKVYLMKGIYLYHWYRGGDKSKKDHLLIKKEEKNNKIAVLLHLYYYDLWPEFENYLKNIPYNYDLYVTLPQNIYLKEDTDKIKNKILVFKKDAFIFEIENKGMDIGACLIKMKHILKQNKSYDYYLKIHTKKSLNTTSSEFATKWRNSLIEPLCGSIEDSMNSINLLKLHNVGMVCSKRWLIKLSPLERFSKNNFNIIKQYANSYNWKNWENTSKFCGGTMFWVKGNVWESFFKELDIDKVYNLFPQGKINDQVNGTHPHSLERIFGILISQNNLKILGI